MYKQIRIRNFRCFEDLTVSSLSRVNLIAGRNNVGKTALLEAIFLLVGPNNPELAGRLNIFRGLQQMATASDAEEVWGWLFRDRNLAGLIELEGSTSDEQRVQLRLRLDGTETGPLSERTVREPQVTEQLTTGAVAHRLMLEFKDSQGREGTSWEWREQGATQVEVARVGPIAAGTYIPSRLSVPSAQFFSRVEEVGGQAEVVETLKILDPRLVRLALLVPAGIPTVYADIGLGRLIPINMLGDGMGRLLGLILAIANARQGVVLVDEIENGLHYSVLHEVWRAIAAAARRFDVQVFATTHSWECIRAAQQAFTTGERYDFSLHRLERGEDGEVRALAFDRESLDVAIAAELEVR